MKRYDLCGLGNAMVDILVEISDQEFDLLGLERGTMRLVDLAEQHELLRRFDDRSPALASGGSVANSVIALAQLGGRGSFIGCLGQDRYGEFYQEEFQQFGITLANRLLARESSGTCLVLITPDAERTMRTSLGISATLGPEHLNHELIAQSKWLFVEGYVFATAPGRAAILEAVKVAKEHRTKVALTLSESWIVENFREHVENILDQTDLLFANEAEARSLVASKTAQAAFGLLCERIGNVVVTCGPDGAYVAANGTVGRVEAFPCSPIDLTGAGDMFAGAFLYALTQQLDPLKAARACCFLAMKVITQVGARLHKGTQEFWQKSYSDLQHGISQI